MRWLQAIDRRIPDFILHVCMVVRSLICISDGSEDFRPARLLWSAALAGHGTSYEQCLEMGHLKATVPALSGSAQHAHSKSRVSSLSTPEISCLRAHLVPRSSWLCLLFHPPWRTCFAVAIAGESEAGSNEGRFRAAHRPRLRHRLPHRLRGRISHAVGGGRVAGRVKLQDGSGGRDRYGTLSTQVSDVRLHLGRASWGRVLSL